MYIQLARCRKPQTSVNTRWECTSFHCHCRTEPHGTPLSLESVVAHGQETSALNDASHGQCGPKCVAAGIALFACPTQAQGGRARSGVERGHDTQPLGAEAIRCLPTAQLVPIEASPGAGDAARLWSGCVGIFCQHQDESSGPTFWVHGALPRQDRTANAMGCWNWFEKRNGLAKLEAASIVAILDHISRLHAMDGARVAIAGLSAGASMAALTALHFPRRFAAVVMHSGVEPTSANSSVTAVAAMQGRFRVPLHLAQQDAAVLPSFAGDSRQCRPCGRVHQWTEGRAAVGCLLPRATRSSASGSSWKALCIQHDGLVCG